MKKLQLILLVFWFTQNALAQDPLFSQFYNNYSYSNPSLTGSSPGITFTGVYRNQWNGLNTNLSNANFLSQYAGVEFAESCSKLGLGFSVMRDEEGAGRLQTDMISASLSYIIPFKVNRGRSIQNFRIGFAPYWTQKQIDWSKLVFSDQLDAKDGILSNAPTAFTPPTDGNQPTWFGFSAGLTYVLNWKKRRNLDNHLTIGVGLLHLPNLKKDIGPVESLLGLDTDVPFRLVAHASLSMPFLQTDVFGQVLKCVPQLKYERQGQLALSTIGTNIYLYPMTLGIYYQNVHPLANAVQNANALSVYFGCSLPHNGQNNFLELGLSYDMNLGGVRSHLGGVLELTIKYRLTKTNIACDQVICRTPGGHWENIWHRNAKNKNLN